MLSSSTLNAYERTWQPSYRADVYVQIQMNRPYGAVDVAANLKGAVPKTATQKILVALAEKGELVQKTYGVERFLRVYEVIAHT